MHGKDVAILLRFWPNLPTATLHSAAYVHRAETASTTLPTAQAGRWPCGQATIVCNRGRASGSLRMPAVSGTQNACAGGRIGHTRVLAVEQATAATVGRN
ncbi:hypothetical protein BHM03_00038410 [Ensete ventricosum]|nr:hypothetical protein BHM03_00038410 [Ensete ventricosum]